MQESHELSSDLVKECEFEELKIQVLNNYDHKLAENDEILNSLF